MRTLSILLFIVLLGSWIGTQTQETAPRPIFNNLNFPVAFAFAPDGRIFFNEKAGNVRVIQNGELLSQPFATIDAVSVGEQGLLGLALHPDFEQNGYLYVFYTYNDGTGVHSRIRRFTAVGNTGTNPSDIFDIPHPTSATNHNGGYIKFGPDGKLYAQVGENAMPALSQDLSSNFGKILRMNDDGSVPADNPFKGSLVYAYGIRNAFGMDFDPNTHMLIETEAGPSTDEINLIKPGANYGWPTCEGVCNNPAFEDPIMTFNPATTPTGIAYASPGTFYFGEWNTGALKRLQLSPEVKVLSVDQVYALGNPGAGIIAVERGPDGNIYFSTPTSIFRYTPSARQTPTTTTEAIREFELSQTITILAVASPLMLAAWLLFRNRLRRGRT